MRRRRIHATKPVTPSFSPRSAAGVVRRASQTDRPSRATLSQQPMHRGVLSSLRFNTWRAANDFGLAGSDKQKGWF